jgi:hypothetical protein
VSCSLLSASLRLIDIGEVLEKRARASGKGVGFEWVMGQMREGFPQVNTSTYTREMYVCQCINGREISTTLKMILNYDERASSTSTGGRSFFSEEPASFSAMFVRS